MSESRSLFGDCHEMAQRYKHLTRFSRFVLYEPAASTIQKIIVHSLSSGKVEMFNFHNAWQWQRVHT